MKDIEEFKKYDNKTPYFKLIGVNDYCRVVDIYDGDTITIVLKIFDKMFYKFIVRLSGIDTCEIHSTNEDTKKIAIKSRNRLFELITNKKYDDFDFKTRKEVKEYFDENVFLLWVHCEDFDKYGRLLAKIFNDPQQKISFSEILIKEKLAYEYNGERKLTEDEQLLILQKEESY